MSIDWVEPVGGVEPLHPLSLSLSTSPRLPEQELYFERQELDFDGHVGLQMNENVERYFCFLNDTKNERTNRALVFCVVPKRKNQEQLVSFCLLFLIQESG